MGDWEATLLAAPQPELQALGTQLASAVKTADVAVEALRKAEQQRTDFAELGDCKSCSTRSTPPARPPTASWAKRSTNTRSETSPPTSPSSSSCEKPAPGPRPRRAGRQDCPHRAAAHQAPPAARRPRRAPPHHRTPRPHRSRHRPAREEVATIEKHLSQERARAEALKAKLSTLSDPAP